MVVCKMAANFLRPLWIKKYSTSYSTLIMITVPLMTLSEKAEPNIVKYELG